MIHFITPTIAIGHAIAAEHEKARRAAGIRSIVCLNGQLAGRTSEDLGVEALRVFDLIDGRGNDPAVFDAAVRAVADFSTKHAPVLVHCTAGQSRSPIVVAAHLARTEGRMLAEALEFIRSKRPIVFPARELLAAWDVDAGGRIRRDGRGKR